MMTVHLIKDLHCYYFYKSLTVPDAIMVLVALFIGLYI